MFDNIIGQKEYIASLRTAIDNNRLPHALLISGNEGTGGLALAYAAAQYLICPHRHDGDACGQCPQCLQLGKLQHPDVHFVFPVVRKKNQKEAPISLDYMGEWREAFLNDHYLTLNAWTTMSSEENKQAGIFVAEANNIIKTLSVKPFESDYRVMIIWLPEKMNEETANKLLKIIEEPNDMTHFFFVSQEPERIIGTIRSRVQRINLPPIADVDIQQALVSRFDCPQEKAIDYARMSHGSYVEALKLLHDDEERSFYFTKFCEMMRLSYAKKLFDMKEWSEELSGIGRERQKAYLQYAQQMIRENFIMNFNTPSLNYLNESERTFSSRFHVFVNHNNVAGIMDELALAEKDIMQNVNAKMVFFDLSLKLIMLLKSANK